MYIGVNIEFNKVCCIVVELWYTIDIHLSCFTVQPQAFPPVTPSRDSAMKLWIYTAQVSRKKLRLKSYSYLQCNDKKGHVENL